MKKHIISLVIILAMALSITTAVFAAVEWETEIDTLGAAVVNGVYYQNLQDAVNAANGGVVTLQQNISEAVTVAGALKLDLNGYCATVNGGTLTLTDSATDNGTVGGKVYGNFTVANRVTEKGVIRYVVLDGTDSNGAYKTANAVRVKVKKLNIRPSSAGLYYITEVRFNENVANQGATYGMALSLVDKPGKDFATDKDTCWTATEAPTGDNFISDSTSCLVRDILVDTKTAQENADRGVKEIHANAYVKLTVDGKEIAIMMENVSDVVYSLKSVMTTLNSNLAAELTGAAALSDTAKKAAAFYNTWANDGMGDWGLTNFQTYVEDNYILDQDVLYHGRTYEKDGVQWFNWSASGFTVQFQGSGLQAEIASNAPKATNYAYLKVYVDGVEQPDILLDKTMQTVTLAENLDPSETHTVEVRKRNSPRSSTAGLVSMMVQDGTKLTPPEEKEMLIEFVGDSLTVGYSAAITDPAAVTAWSTATEDGTKTYSKQVADAFNADYMVTAISGRGVVMNNSNDGAPWFPDIYPELDYYNDRGTAYDFALQPDVIVINLGTNDATNSNLDIDVFQAGVVSFIELVRQKNPNAQIIWAYGLRQDTKTAQVATAIEAAVTQIRNSDTKVHYLPLDLVSSSQTDLNHPLAEGYTASGEKLIAKITEITGVATVS